MSSTEAKRIPIVSCSECRDAYDVHQWDALRMIEKREPVGDHEGAELRECVSCDAPIVVPVGLLAAAREGYFVATVDQYEAIYPETASPTVSAKRGWVARAADALAALRGD
jgi:hypothetical protein